VRGVTTPHVRLRRHLCVAEEELALGEELGLDVRIQIGPDGKPEMLRFKVRTRYAEGQRIIPDRPIALTVSARVQRGPYRVVTPAKPLP